MRARLVQKLLVGGILWPASVTTVAAAPKAAAPMLDHAVLQTVRKLPQAGMAVTSECPQWSPSPHTRSSPMPMRSGRGSSALTIVRRT